MLFKYKCIIQYIGDYYIGWQRQTNGIAVQEIIQKAIGQFNSSEPEIHCSGRTDSGVHALGQCIHFELEKDYNQETLLKSLNHFLINTGICVVDCKNLGQYSDFHARFSSKNRTYVYKIFNSPTPDVFLNCRAWWIRKPLNLDRLKSLCSDFIGTHDFSTFRAKDCQARSPIKSLTSFNVNYADNLFLFTINAPSFLHNQVRNMVGTLVDVSLFKFSDNHIIDALEKPDRKKCGTKAPPFGLYFKSVQY